MQSLNSLKAGNIRKTWFLLLVFFSFILAVGYVLSVYLQSPGIMFGAGFFSLFSSVGTYWFSDKIALSMANAKPVTKETHAEIYSMVDNLAIASGLPTPRIYMIEDGAMNAFATGRNPENSVIAFTTGIVEQLEKEELRGVAAHEMSHIINRDMLIGTIAVVLASALAMVGRFTQMGMGGEMNRIGDNRGGNPFRVIITIGLLVLAPVLAQLLRLAVSRKREYLADASGAMLTGNPEGLASALEKIGGSPKKLDKASEMTAHLFIDNPFKNTKVTNFFSTHPPMEKRVELLRNADKDASTGQI